MAGTKSHSTRGSSQSDTGSIEDGEVAAEKAAGSAEGEGLAQLTFVNHSLGQQGQKVAAGRLC